MQTMVPITAKGAILLKEELERLKKIERPRVINAIAEARAHGDLRENAEYHAAREEQSFIEGRIRDIEGKLSNCQIIDVSTMTNEGKVIFGSTVKLFNLATETEVLYQIVGEDEADIKANKISISSPIARALIGKFIDDVVSIKVPEGVSEYEIISVEYL